MQLKHYFAAYFIWLIFNRSNLVESYRETAKNYLILRENKWPFLYFIRYIVFVCAACFCFWLNLLLSIRFGDLFDLILCFIIVFSFETLLASLKKISKN